VERKDTVFPLCHTLLQKEEKRQLLMLHTAAMLELFTVKGSGKREREQNGIECTVNGKEINVFD
jgi:hypothetical protein